MNHLYTKYQRLVSVGKNVNHCILLMHVNDQAVLMVRINCVQRINITFFFKKKFIETYYNC